MKYNLSKIMTSAWKNFRKISSLTFAEALHRAWISAKAEAINQKRIAEAKAEANITEDCDTWHGWKLKGYEVIHGSRSLFGADLIWGSHGDGAIYKARFFGFSQVAAVQ